MSISTPIVADHAGIYTFTFDTDRIRATVDRITEDSKHNVHGEVLITLSTALVSTQGHLYRTRLNLLSTSAKKATARLLGERMDLDWDMILESVCHHVLERHRMGEPVVALGDVVINDQVKYRVAPLVTDGEHNLLYGDSGIGKSLIAGYLAFIVSEGILDCGLVPLPGPVLYLDYETSQDVTARRFRAFHVGFALDYAPQVLYRFCHQPVAGDIQSIQRAVADNGIQLGLGDRAGPACGGEPESAQSALSFFAALRSLRCTTLTIAHKAKNHGVGPFGSMFWTAYPRNVYEVKKVQDQGASAIHLGLFHRKVNDGELLRPRGFTFAFDGGGVTVSATDMRHIPEFEGELSTGERLNAILADGAMSVGDLATALDVPQSSISMVFKRNSGERFCKLPDGRWGLRAI